MAQFAELRPGSTGGDARRYIVLESKCMGPSLRSGSHRCHINGVAGRWSLGYSLFGVVEQDDVGFSVASKNGQLLAIVGVVEIADELRLEIGELLSR
jgi:hypothetical protein